MTVQALPVNTRLESRLFECRLFGSLAVVVDDAEVDLGGPKQRLVLAILLSRVNAMVPLDVLIDAVWPDAPPRTARKNVQVYVSQLRKVLGDRLGTCGRGIGYRLRLTPEECDLVRFRQLAETGRAALHDGDQPLAAALLGQAIRLWTGQPFAEFAYIPYLAEEIDHLLERFLATLEDWAELEVDRGRYGDVLELLDRCARQYPMRERLAALRMRALAATGRSGDALAHFEFVRQELARELGADPSRSLADVHRKLLRGEDVAGATEPGRTRPPTVLTHLPRDLTDFTGRATQVREVANIFADEHGHDTVVVTGEVGLGKTAFAVHVANALASSFPDGRILLKLDNPDGTARGTGEVLEELLGVIGLGAGTRAASYALVLWRSWVAQRRLLLILDGATQESVVSDLLPGSSRNRAIVTSRHRLSGLVSVRRIELGPLTDEESHDLLGQVTGPERLRADPRCAHELVECCAGLPLALRIVGAKLAALRHVGLAEFAARLRGAVLDELHVGDLDLRSRYEAFTRSLSPAQCEAFQRIAALGSAHPEDEPAVESLLECGLLAVSGSGYVLPRFAHLFFTEAIPSC